MRKLVVVAGAMLIASALQPAFAQEEAICVDKPNFTYEIIEVEGGVRVIVHPSGFCSPWRAIAAGLVAGLERQRQQSSSTVPIAVKVTPAPHPMHESEDTSLTQSALKQ